MLAGPSPLHRRWLAATVGTLAEDAVPVTITEHTIGDGLVPRVYDYVK